MLLCALALVTSACLGGESGGGQSAGGGGGGGGEEGGGGGGEILAAFEGDEATRFQAVVDAFNEETGNDIQFTSATAFETEVNTRFQSGNPPDIAIWPNPGGLLDQADNLKPLSEIEGLDLEEYQGNIVPGFLDAASQDGEFYGIPYRMAVKSIVWTPEPAFSEAGYEVPETYDDLVALTNEIRESGATPWCIGAESGEATGWVFTDWIEEYVLRMAGPEVYDQWVAHEIPFNDPQILEAARQFEQDIFTNENVLGGLQGAVSTNFGDAFNPAFDEEPGCYMMRQGNFITSEGFFPDEIREDLSNNVGTFYFPSGIEGGVEENPVLLGGDIAARADTDSAAADAFMAFLTTPEAAEPWATEGGFLTPLSNFDPSLFPDDITRDIFQIGVEADVARYDASDQMPGAVANAFWAETVSWASGSQDLEAAFQTIEETWQGQE
jgi:alpha-glucoside transport system substrate-binding protein